jgi:outer membrane lipoprotein SlyB
MQSRWIGALSLLIAVAVCYGCASRKPIIDTANVDMEQYERDLAECEEVATQVDTAGRATESAAAGAAVGAAQGAIWGRAVGQSAASGAVTGGAGGLYAADHETARVIKNCMRQRGYAVLN